MVTLDTANSALKEVYLGVLANQLNIEADKITESTNCVWDGKTRSRYTAQGTKLNIP